MGIELAWGRIFFLYGPHEGRARLVPSVVVPLLKNQPVLVGDGKARRDFMHLKDVARAFVKVLESPFVGAVNIASGETRPMRDVVLAIAEQIGRPDLIRFGARPTQVGEPAMLGTSSRGLREIGFDPQFTLELGLSDTIDWWRGALATGSQNTAWSPRSGVALPATRDL
jgi:nucleoside-diphosphate-sugar epimerase